MMNLIPITMAALGVDLESAVRSTVEEIYRLSRDFDEISSKTRATFSAKHEPEVTDQLRQLIQAYEAIVTGVLHFSIESPRYGMLKYRREDGSFVVEL